MNTRTRLAAVVAAAALTLGLTACGGGSDGQDSTITDAVQRCQDTVREYVKYPATIQWADPRLAEEQNGIVYINGGADVNNDAGNPVPVNYSCDLDTSTDEWARPPSMEPKNSTDGRWQTSRWGAAASPMLEKYGDQMSMRGNPLGL